MPKMPLVADHGDAGGKPITAEPPVKRDGEAR
jgi:hypothetical protein